MDEIKIKAPAKINLFLHVLRKRKDGYHDIESGISLINLYDEISIKKNTKTNINFEGPFKPDKGYYENCIIKKTLNFLGLDNNFNFNINIKKNIPTEAGLGSASTNAAALIKALDTNKIRKINTDYKFYSSIGADIPFFLFGKNAIVSGIGEKLNYYKIPSYYFLLVKPLINFSTKNMYGKISRNISSKKNKEIKNYINNDYKRNDFEAIAIKENNEMYELINFLSSTKNCIFSRMSGSGSCCYATYDNLNFAVNAQKNVKDKFPKYWSFVANNNTINTK